MCRKYQFVTFVTCNFCNFCNAVRCIINLSSNNLTYNQKFTSFFCSFQKKIVPLPHISIKLIEQHH